MTWQRLIALLQGKGRAMSGEKVVEKVVVLDKQEILPGAEAALTAVPTPPTTPGADQPRAAFDAYPTPTPFAEGMVWRVLNVIPYKPAAIIEPSAGNGVFVRAVQKAWPGVPVIAVEVQPGSDKALYEAGAEVVSIANWIDVAEAIDRATAIPGPWLFIGNPPYLEAVEHIEAALRIMQPGEWLCFLLRINFFGSNGRKAFWARKKDRLRYLLPFTQRPKFRNNRSDATEYGCFIWQKGWTGDAEILPNMDIAEELIRDNNDEEK